MEVLLPQEAQLEDLELLLVLWVRVEIVLLLVVVVAVVEGTMEVEEVWQLAVVVVQVTLLDQVPLSQRATIVAVVH